MKLDIYNDCGSCGGDAEAPEETPEQPAEGGEMPAPKAPAEGGEAAPEAPSPEAPAPEAPAEEEEESGDEV